MGKILKSIQVKVNQIKSKLGKKSSYLIAIILGIIVLIIFFNGISDKTNGTKNEKVQEPSSFVDQYAQSVEQRLSQILSSLSGVGEVQAFVMTESSIKTIYEVDEKTDSTTERDKTSSSVSKELVFSKDGSSSVPITALEVYPEIVGVLVVAEAESDEKTRLMIINAVSVALNIENSKIEVLLTKN